ncbi:OB-fold protein [Terrisporobacter glycolicus]|uniref:tRNA_anti-like n=1 Tax=Terrisporobacter glycolicus ATCC 14880 = DSM 1288 TaxID=1121315 RepID=A0ABZ2EW16_9FIRM|nr:hypothetical protein [Terrisporobacter glycolicus]
MEKRVQCMKINNENNIILYSIILLVYYIVFYKYKDIVILRYIFITIIIVILFLIHRFYYKKNDVSVTSEELLNEYKENIYECDKKYNEKYVKLTGVVSKLEITNKKDLYIFFESNNKFIIIANSVSINNKCLEYIKSISKGDRITIYGDLFRTNNELRIFMWYILQK